MDDGDGTCTTSRGSVSRPLDTDDNNGDTRGVVSLVIVGAAETSIVSPGGPFYPVATRVLAATLVFVAAYPSAVVLWRPVVHWHSPWLNTDCDRGSAGTATDTCRCWRDVDSNCY